MKRLLIIMCLLPSLVLAEHHRSHAISFVDAAHLHNEILQSKVSIYEQSGCTFTAAQQTSIDVLFRYSGFITINLASVQAILEDPAGDLDEARRKITRPNGDPPNSADTLAKGLLSRSRMLITACPEANVYLAQIVQRIEFVWENIDRINWHIQDAIREEVYSDPALICSGPNNHCE